jgi:hypothetical protein
LRHQETYLRKAEGRLTASKSEPAAPTARGKQTGSYIASTTPPGRLESGPAHSGAGEVIRELLEHVDVLKLAPKLRSIARQSGLRGPVIA